MFLDGNRTSIFSLSRGPLTQLSYQFDNRSTAAHPKNERRTKDEMGIHQLPDGARFERARPDRSGLHR